MSENRYRPNIAIHPGKTLGDTIEALSMTQAELAERTGLTKKTINEIIQSKNPITPESAIKLGAVFGTSATFWNNLQRNYEEALVRIQAEKELNEELCMLSSFKCYGELAQWGYVEKTREPKKKIVNLLNFFGISSLKFVPNVHSIAFRQTKQSKVNQESLAAWLRCGEIEAQKQPLMKYNKEKLYGSINKLRALTKQPPETFSLELIKICASCGIAVTFVPYFKKTYVNGATKWLNIDTALIQLSLRGGYDDIFWFTFFHELGHILKHGKKDQFVEFDYKNKNVIKDKEEEANDFARNTLISKSEYSRFVRQNDFSTDSIRSFAKEIDVSPSIIAGRLSHDNKNWTKWTYLRKRLKFTKDH